MNELFRHQQELYRQPIRRNGIDEQLQALERRGSPPPTGSDAAADAAGSRASPAR